MVELKFMWPRFIIIPNVLQTVGVAWCPGTLTYYCFWWSVIIYWRGYFIEKDSNG